MSGSKAPWLAPLLAGLIVNMSGYSGLFISILIAALLAVFLIWQFIIEPRGKVENS